MNESSTSLRVSRLTKNFDTAAGSVEVLRGVDLHVDGGEAVVILGPSGSGKSTLLHVVGTLDRPTTGRVEIDGRDPFSLDEEELARFRNHSVGFVFQDHYLLPQYSVLENVVLPSLAFPSEEAGQAPFRARQLLDRVGLSHRLDHRPSQLSGGERQRVAIVRALLHSPSLLLCDEPTGNLDSETAAIVTEMLFELHRDMGNILLVITHSLDLAAHFERRLVLTDGQLSDARSSDRHPSDGRPGEDETSAVPADGRSS